MNNAAFGKAMENVKKLKEEGIIWCFWKNYGKCEKT